MRYLLDTNICVHWLRGRHDVGKAVDRIGMDNCCISEITAAELLFGAHLVTFRTGRQDDLEVVRRFISALRVIPISSGIEMFAWEKARLRLEGREIEDFDLLIACCAVSEGAVLVSENVSHMERVSGVRLENWIAR